MTKQLKTCPTCGALPCDQCNTDFGWQPIETAPKDGSQVIVYRPNANEYIPHISSDYWVRGKYWGSSNETYFPTHWMPLPEPPEDTP